MVKQNLCENTRPTRAESTRNTPWKFSIKKPPPERKIQHALTVFILAQGIKRSTKKLATPAYSVSLNPGLAQGIWIHCWGATGWVLQPVEEGGCSLSFSLFRFCYIFKKMVSRGFCLPRRRFSDVFSRMAFGVLRWFEFSCRDFE